MLSAELAMTATKGASRRKCAAHEPGKATKKPTTGVAKKTKRVTVAAKRKHVRELAKAGRWHEIERLYGKKIVTKAKTYVESLGVKKKTPLEIAHEILIKNGYLPCGLDTTASRILPIPVEHQPAGSGTRECSAESTVTATASNSPVKLTTEQQKRIETRRQEALKRRRRVQQVARTHECRAPPPAVLQLSRPVDVVHRSTLQANVPIQEQRLLPPQASRTGVSSGPAGLPKTDTQCVVPVESSPWTTSVVETKHSGRAERFWDDLEAAAEIVQWENEHMAEAALEEQLPVTTIAPEDACGDMYRSSHDRFKSTTANNQPPAVISFSQELLAAADIIQWEKEHEDLPEAPAALDRPGDNSDSDQELAAPQFQLLPVHVTDDFEQPSKTSHDSAHCQVKNSRDRPKSNGQPHTRGTHNRSPVAEPQPAQKHSSAVPTRVVKASDVHQLHQTPLHPSQNQHDPTTEFIDKHLLENKLEFPVLEFLDMMLA